MAWTTLGTVAPGDVLRANSGTAAYNNVIGNLYAGQPIFTNEAARDAAITSPYEGQHVYLTASTVAAATGAITAVPTGVTTIYNGSVWVCTTPVGARATSVATTTSTSFVTTLTGDGTAISVTLVTGTTAEVSFSGQAQNSAALHTAEMSISVSGATTLSASNTNGIEVNETTAAYNFFLGRHYILTGLTAGTNTFTLNYKTTANTATYARRDLIVRGVA